MELLAVIHHPGKPIRAARDIAAQLAAVYDKVFDAPGHTHLIELPHTLIVMRTWAPKQLGWKPWHVDGTRTLATVGLPALHCPPGARSEMLSPAKLASLVHGRGHLPHGDLAFAGGYFAAALVDADASRVRLVTNYAGDMALYRAERDGVTVWSSRAPVAALLAGLPGRLDTTAARRTLLLWRPLGNADIWEGVEVEPAATCINLDAAGMERHRYIDAPRGYFAHGCDNDDLIAAHSVATIKPLVEALAEHTDATRLHLTGGHDSRCAAAILRHHGLRPHSVTLNTPNVDAPVARRLAMALDLPHTEHAGRLQDAEGFLADAQRAAWLGGGSMSLKYLAARDHLRHPRDEGYTPMTGIGGETGRAVYFDTDEAVEQVGRADFQRLHYKIMYRRPDFWPCADDVTAIHTDVDRLLREAMDAGLTGHQAATWYWLDQKVRRWESHRRTCGYVWPLDPLRMPCWTYAAAASSPAAQVHDRLIDGLTAFAWPAAAAVPTVGQTAIQRHRRRVAANRVQRAGYALIDRWSGRRSAGAQHVQHRALSALRPAMRHLLAHTGDELARIVDPAIVEQWIAARTPSYYETDLFWNALSLAGWCGTFVDQPAGIAPAALPAQGAVARA